MAPGRNSTARPHPAGLGLSRLSGCVSASRVAPGARQGPLPWLAPPEGGAAGPRARLSWRPRSPLQRLGRQGGLTGNQAPIEGAAGRIVPPSHKGLQGTKGEIWFQSHAANSGLTPDSSTLQKSGANQPDPARWGQEVREQSSLVHTPLSPSGSRASPLSAHLTLIPSPPSPPLPYHLGVFLFITTATIPELSLDPGRGEILSLGKSRSPVRVTRSAEEETGAPRGHGGRPAARSW